MTGVSHVKKLKLETLSLLSSFEDNRWFQDPVNVQVLPSSLRLGTKAFLTG